MLNEGFAESLANAFMRISAKHALDQKQASSVHPKPWRVEYYRRCVEWHEKSSPCIVDANGETVVDMPCNVGHPGAYDEVADQTAQRIVDAVNAAE